MRSKINKRVKWLASNKRSNEEIKEWIKSFLKDEETNISDSRIYLPDVFTDIYNRSVEINPNVKDEIFIAVKSLVSEFNAISLNDYNKRYFYRLITIIGRLGIAGTFYDLLAYLKERTFSGILAFDTDIHYHLLRVILGFRANREDLINICEKDIENPKYAPLCFRALWEYKYEKGFQAIPILLKHYKKNEQFPIESTLNRFFEQFTNDNLYDYLISLLDLERVIMICLENYILGEKND